VAFNWCGSTTLRWWGCIGFLRGEFKDGEKWGRVYFIEVCCYIGSGEVWKLTGNWNGLRELGY
jgi:hypothetical protein